MRKKLSQLETEKLEDAIFNALPERFKDVRFLFYFEQLEKNHLVIHSMRTEDIALYEEMGMILLRADQIEEQIEQEQKIIASN